MIVIYSSTFFTDMTLHFRAQREHLQPMSPEVPREHLQDMRHKFLVHLFLLVFLHKLLHPPFVPRHVEGGLPVVIVDKPQVNNIIQPQKHKIHLYFFAPLLRDFISSKSHGNPHELLDSITILSFFPTVWCPSDHQGSRRPQRRRTGRTWISAGVCHAGTAPCSWLRQSPPGASSSSAAPPTSTARPFGTGGQGDGGRCRPLHGSSWSVEEAAEPWIFTFFEYGFIV